MQGHYCSRMYFTIHMQMFATIFIWNGQHYRSKQVNSGLFFHIFTASFVNIFRCGTGHRAMKTRGNWPKAPAFVLRAHSAINKKKRIAHATSQSRKYMLKGGRKPGRLCERKERRKGGREKKGLSLWDSGCGESNAVITHTFSSLVFAFMTWPWIRGYEIGFLSVTPRCHSPLPHTCPLLSYNAISPSPNAKSLRFIKLISPVSRIYTHYETARFLNFLITAPTIQSFDANLGTSKFFL